MTVTGSLLNSNVGYVDNRLGAAKPASKRLYPNAVDNCNGNASGMAHPGSGAACPPSRGEAVSPGSVSNSKLSAPDSPQAMSADAAKQRADERGTLQSQIESKMVSIMDDSPSAMDSIIRNMA